LQNIRRKKASYLLRCLCEALYFKRLQDLVIKKNFHLLLWPIAYAVACYERGFSEATLGFSFVIYLGVGIVFSIRVLYFNFDYFRNNIWVIALQLIYLIGFIIHWFSSNPFDRTASWLTLPFLCGLCLFSIVKLYKRMFHA
jgi:hypothetical protein